MPSLVDKAQERLKEENVSPLVDQAVIVGETSSSIVQAPSALVQVVGFPLPNGRPLDLSVGPGEFVLLSGANGSGKTTLLRFLSGLPPASAVLKGTRFPTPAPPTTTTVLATQEPRDTLIGLTVAGEFRLRRLRSVSHSVAHWADRDVATLSSGEARHVGLAVTSETKPKVLLLDEPCEGLDNRRKQWLLDIVAAVQKGACVVASDHTGTLSPWATRSVRLTEEPVVDLPALARVDGPKIVEAGARTHRLEGMRLALPRVDLGPGFHAVAGPNGCGKSTLLRRLAGLQWAEAVTVRGEPPELGQSVRLLLPRARDLFTRSAVREELGGIDEGWRERAPPSWMTRHPLTLSAGEAQRVALLKTLGRPAPLYLLDEPEAHLDPDGVGFLWGLLEERLREGSCILAATHDRRLFDRAFTVIPMELAE